MSVFEKIDKDNIPRHVAIIMDGNGRWAEEKGLNRVFGHQNGITAVKEVAEAAAEIHVPFLTLYAFSTENWNRPKYEINALMELMVETIRQELSTLLENNVKLNIIGQVDDLPSYCLTKLQDAIMQTAHHSHMTLTIALSYGSRWEIMEAAKKLAADIAKGKITADDVSAKSFSQYLTTHNMPDPELLIRTSGERRLSNFLLWQAAYSELYFTHTLWPDFRKKHFFEAIYEYQQRERRFGKTSEQVKQ